MTNEEKKARMHANHKRWYDRVKDDPEFKAKNIAKQAEQYERHREKRIAYARAYRRRIEVKVKTGEYTQRYYAEHRDEILAKQRERYANLTPEQRAQHSRAVQRAEKRRKAVQRASRTQRELEAKAQSVAAELNRLFEQWDR